MKVSLLYVVVKKIYMRMFFCGQIEWLIIYNLVVCSVIENCDCCHDREVIYKKCTNKLTRLTWTATENSIDLNYCTQTIDGVLKLDMEALARIDGIIQQ